MTALSDLQAAYSTTATKAGDLVTAEDALRGYAATYAASGGAGDVTALQAALLKSRGAARSAVAQLGLGSSAISGLITPNQSLAATGKQLAATIGTPRLITAAVTTGTVVAAVDCGATGSFTDAAGQTWGSDPLAGTGNTTDNSAYTTAGVTDQRLWQTERWSATSFTYNITVPTGTTAYVLSTYWVHHFSGNAVVGAILNDVTVEGTKRVAALDVYNMVGLHNALTIERNVTCTDGQMTITFSGAVGATVAGVGELVGFSIRAGANAVSDPAPIGGGSSSSGGVLSGTRDPFLRPFSRTSIWNTPVGDGATYVASGITAIPAGTFGFDNSYVVQAAASDPVVTWYNPGSWVDRDSGTTILSSNTVKFPSALIIPDATTGNTPNNAGGIVQPDGEVYEIAALTHSSTAAKIWGYTTNAGEHGPIRGSGLGYGTQQHGGSGLSCIGGLIRVNELTSAEPIRHPLSVILYAHAYYKRNATPSLSYRWPANRCDSYAGDGSAISYAGLNNDLMPGSLLAIKPVASGGPAIPSQVSANAQALKIWNCFQDYGGYCTEDSAWVGAYLGTDYLARTQIDSALAGIVGTYIFPALSIVSNNAAVSIGGGGTPRQPLAEDFIP